MHWIISWVGDNDLRAADGTPRQGEGPIGDFLRVVPSDRLVLLHNRLEDATRFAAWVEARHGARARVLTVPLSCPFDFDAVYEKTLEAIDEFAAHEPEFRAGTKSYLLSPGTKAMGAALLLIGCVNHRGDLHTNWEDLAVPDPARRTARIEYFDRFGLSLWAIEEPGLSIDEIFRDADGREITHLATVRATYERAAQAALAGVPILIHGETGTGKEILARYIHRSSPRHRGRFVPVNCGAIPPELVDSHLFGHIRGAFTGALVDSPGLLGQADGGTLFLDEIGELPLATQARLLRFLQEGEVLPVGATQVRRVNVRVVAASHRDLQAMARAERFRADLYFRLAGYTLRLPPLRERLDDLPLLCGSVISAWEADRKFRVRIEPAAWRALRAYGWPGNVRELHSILTRCLIDSRVGKQGDRIIDHTIIESALAEQGLGPVPAASATTGVWLEQVAALVATADDYTQAMFEIEAALIRRVISQSPSRAEAARRLHLTPQRLNAKLKTLAKRNLPI